MFFRYFPGFGNRIRSSRPFFLKGERASKRIFVDPGMVDPKKPGTMAMLHPAMDRMRHAVALGF